MPASINADASNKSPVSDEGELNPFIIPVIIGDGVGPDIWRAAEPVLLKAARSSGHNPKFVEVPAGAKAFEATGSYLPAETLETLKKRRVSLKGPLATPVGGGMRSLNVAIRQALDLYACIRPVKWIPGVPSPVKHPEKTDIILFRENTEDVYAGLEWKAGSNEANSLIDFSRTNLNASIREGSAVGLKPMSEFCSKRLVRLALEWALKEKRPNLTLVHKGNIMKFTEGAFRAWGYELAKAEFGALTVPESEAVPGDARLIIKDRIADNMFMQSLLRPEEYSVLAMPNLNGDYLSDCLAGQIGGLGMAPGANIGDGLAVFEATHGTAPKYQGQDKVNPSSLILSGAFMMEYLGWNEAADRIRLALKRTVADGLVTYDLARQDKKLKEVGCSQFGEAVAERL
ncbi:MAG: NADP-dependent isocitrate dehydrogenase [Deltaproteobacteria bacterium]|jgi:isocitrate dehydrogenase|nr:NADP-dependent isocitrate dehydrogenase [Deltaproteobacteria bacterium]